MCLLFDTEPLNGLPDILTTVELFNLICETYHLIKISFKNWIYNLKKKKKEILRIAFFLFF
ncbi:hypothetical protein BpHYR1_047349 [Brachionus plicatilis]|uniref:Uncharacterized protein n=1 Tax=Brachionus plicatilis TaxID=10195 RepID=A0A3M7SQ49_BRAPC|nr:hypothetical protein BpHYR1_047349 [Brachionus plicatilis]